MVEVRCGHRVLQPPDRVRERRRLAAIPVGAEAHRVQAGQLRHVHLGFREREGRLLRRVLGRADEHRRPPSEGSRSEAERCKRGERRDQEPHDGKGSLEAG